MRGGAECSGVDAEFFVQFERHLAAMGHDAEGQAKFCRLNAWLYAWETAMLRSQRRNDRRLRQEEHAERTMVVLRQFLHLAHRRLPRALFPRDDAIGLHAEPLGHQVGRVAALLARPDQQRGVDVSRNRGHVVSLKHSRGVR